VLLSRSPILEDAGPTITSASSDVIPLVRSQSARKRVTNHVRGVPLESRLREYRKMCGVYHRYPRRLQTTHLATTIVFRAIYLFYTNSIF